MSENKRKGLSKKIRFEVFKRDNFTCQYCGRKAPDVILEVDHIKPIFENGENDILNLITSCFDCNHGKGKKELSDKHVIEKQMIELEQLNKRREQLDMILEWRESLKKYNQEEIEIINKVLSERMSCTLNDKGEENMKKSIKKYGIKEVLEVIDISIEQYYKNNEESRNKAVSYIYRILKNRTITKNAPYLKDLYYIRGILRNRLYYLNENQTLDLLKKAYEKTQDIELLKNISYAVKNWTEFKSEIFKILENDNEIHD